MASLSSPRPKLELEGASGEVFTLTVHLEVVMSVVHSCPVGGDTGVGGAVGHLGTRYPGRFRRHGTVPLTTHLNCKL